jgi:hypothetical protein
MNISSFMKAEDGAIHSAGRYDYYLNDVLQPISETWQCFKNSRGDLVTDSAREAGQLRLRSRAIAAGEGFKQVLVEWRADDTIQALYKLTEQCCYWQINGGDELEFNLIAAPIYPLMRVYTGPVMKQLARAGGTTIIVPDIRLDIPPRKKLRPYTTERRSGFLGQDEISIQAQQVSCERWSFIGDQYLSDSRFYLDAGGNLLCYSWLQAEGQMWRVERVTAP